jgi:DNA-binding MarR family transcriptional regulator
MIDEFIKRIHNALNRLIFIEKSSAFEFEGIKLYPSEIHLMLETKGENAVNATRIAERLGVTKSAISQTISRLEKKGIVYKEKDAYNKNELAISLTPLGKKAFDKYEALQVVLFQKLFNYLSALTENERELLDGILSQIESMFKSD